MSMPLECCCGRLSGAFIHCDVLCDVLYGYHMKTQPAPSDLAAMGICPTASCPPWRHATPFSRAKSWKSQMVRTTSYLSYPALPRLLLPMSIATDKALGCDDQLFAMMKDCWVDDPAARPRFSGRCQPKPDLTSPLQYPLQSHSFSDCVCMSCAHPAALQLQLETQIAAAGTVTRDIGSSLNAMLTQNLRQASMRASMQRKVVNSRPATLRRVWSPDLAFRGPTNSPLLRDRTCHTLLAFLCPCSLGRVSMC